jgi:hypothetical protein
MTLVVKTLLNLHSRKNACFFISEECRESLSKVRQSFVTKVCVERNRARPRRTTSPANATSIRDPVPGRRSSRAIFLATITKRAAAIPTIALPRMINASAAILQNFWPDNSTDDHRFFHPAFAVTRQVIERQSSHSGLIRSCFRCHCHLS